MKNYLLGAGFLVLAFYLIWQQGAEQIEYSDRLSNKEVNEQTQRVEVIEGNSSPYSITPGIEPGIVNSEDSTPFAAVVQLGEEKLTDGLSTNLSSITFSNHTGAIRSVQLHQSERLNKAYDIDHSEQPFLGIAFEDESGALLSEALPNPRDFRLIESSPSRVVYRWESPGNLSIDRIYERSEVDGYGLIHKTVFRSLRDSPMVIDRVRMYLGSSFQIPRMYNPFDQATTYLSVGYYNEGAPLPEGCSCATCSGRIDGEREEFFQLNEMGPSGKIEPRRLSKAKWACVNNQFFVNLLRPESELNDFRVWGESVQSSTDESGKEILGISGAVSFPLGIFKPKQSKEFSFKIYAGPKDYIELSKLAHEQKKVMQFGVFWWISEPFSWALNKLSSILGSYGLGIIVLTVLVKLILWPLTAQATRSQKKMQALQGPLGKLREKHKGSPQKLNQEMMKFYKEHKVNPFAGCWPILVQIPIFLGMFWMLRSAAELYGQEFLWAMDLSEQDSVAMLYGFSLNVLPIFMVLTQWYQMRLNPMQLGPEMSEAQRINAKMMRFMPFMFLVFLYFFSSALVLYWTVQNIMTILQTLLTKNVTLPNLTEKDEKGRDKSFDRKSVREVQDIEYEEESDDEERKLRNLLGLKAKGKIDLKLLESRYKERMNNYTSKRLENMSEQKRTSAEEKRDKITEAYETLRKMDNKQS
ncbi:MAG: YidC/Oxa1 family insertase periplasmic-domain containing protein [Opitutales bacterium]|nr:YidC/Oxa1 family insertase periplasmic-domain containing protein [Opitutales bacterium]